MFLSNDHAPVGPEPQSEIDLGDLAELTEGVGKSSAESKRQPYN